MFILPTPKDFREWQIWHYEKRLAEAKTKNEIIFLTQNLKSWISAD